MFATFIYPLLLQPLLVYYQRLPDTNGRVPAMLDPFATRAFDRATVDFNQIGRAPPHVSAPAKTAMFTLASVFHLISNRPLIRLLYTALFHPLSPDTSGETVINSEGSVTSVDDDNKKTIRLDDPSLKGLDERLVYPFGGKVEASSAIDTEVESCVYVLAPALASVLKNPGQGKTRPNPYRRALLQCLEVPHHMADFRKLSVMTIDAALSLFNGHFLAETLLGNELAAEAEVDKEWGLPRYTVEVVSALCESLVNGRNGPFGTFILLFFFALVRFSIFCSYLPCHYLLQDRGNWISTILQVTRCWSLLGGALKPWQWQNKLFTRSIGKPRPCSPRSLRAFLLRNIWVRL